MDQVICDALRQELDAQIALSPGFRWGATVLAGQPITMEDVLSETAITYPEVYVQEMTGSQIKAIMEDICDNLFNPDPIISRAATWCGSAEWTTPARRPKSWASRISDMRLDDGRPIEADKSYRVAGWASVNPQQGKAVSDVLAGYLRREKTVSVKRANRVTLKGVAENPGTADQG